MDSNNILVQVPGIGPATVELLKHTTISYDNKGNVVTVSGITSTFALIGVYLSFKSEYDPETGESRTVGTVEHAQRFYLWWCSLGTSPGHRAGVVNCICEKVNISYPGIYNSADYNDLQIS